MPTSPSWGSRKRCQGQLTQGQLTQVTQVKTGTTTLASNASYYPNGALAQFTYGNGIVHTMTQNARQLPSHSVDGSVLDLSTVFDENGNVAAITDNTASARQTRSMSYDGLDRLTATTSPMFGTASYAYDPQDNLTRVQVTGGSQPRDHYYCYNASNQLAFVRSGPNCTGTTSPAVIALAYDVQGNLSIKNGASYAFDFGNRLRTTAGQSYRYDAQGRRVRQDVAGSQLQYSQYAADGRLVWQRDETTNQRIANAYLAGSLLAEISRPLTGSTTTIRYLHTDALGSPIAKTSTSGAIIETSEYEPYGRLLNRANDNRAGYTGHVMDAASGLTYMQQRYYDPAIGAFLSVDPVTAYSNPVGAFNRYRYGDDNPFGLLDPDGREPAAPSDKPKHPDLPDNVPKPPKGCGIARNCYYYGEAWHFFPTPSGQESNISVINDGPIESVCPECYFLGGLEISGYKSIVATRVAYVDGVGELVAWGNRLRAAGWSSEKIARLLVPLRNQLKDQIRRTGPITAKMWAEARNTWKYGNRLGPSAEQLVQKANGNWDKVVEGIGKTDDWLNKFLGI